MGAGDETAAPLATLRDLMARQAVADWRAVLTAIQGLDQVGLAKMAIIFIANWESTRKAPSPRPTYPASCR
jgi:hypothetical protein